MAAPRQAGMPTLCRHQARTASWGLQHHTRAPETGADAACAECGGVQPASVPRSIVRSVPEESEGVARATAASSLPKSLARLSGFFRHDSRAASQDEGSRPVATH